MKIILLLLFVVGICKAQIIPHIDSIAASKDSVLSTEEFSINYFLTGVEGFIYVGIEDLYFDVIGKNMYRRWMKSNDTLNATFKIKFRNKFKPTITSERVPVCIGYSYKPFSERPGEFVNVECLYIVISDFNEFKRNSEKVDSTKTKNGKILILHPLDTRLQRFKKTIQRDSTTIIVE